MSSPFIDPQTGGMNPGAQPVGEQLLTPTGGGASPPGMTLGQANAAAGGTDYVQSYNQALQALRGSVRYAQMDQPSILRNILSFGQVGRDYDATQRYNAQLDYNTANMAREMVANQATANALGSRQQLATLGMGIRLAQLEQQIHQSNLTEAQREFERNRQTANDKLKRKHGVPSQADIDWAEANGLEWQQDPQDPNFFNAVPAGTGGGGAGGGGNLTERPDGGWDLPANSPAGKAYGAVGGGGGTPPDTQGQSPGDIIAGKKAQRKGAERAAAENAAADAETLRNMGVVESWFKDPQFETARQGLPNMAMGPAGPARMWLARKGGLGGDAQNGAVYLDTANTNIMPSVRALEAGAKNMRLGGAIMASVGLQKQFDEMLSGRMPPSEMAAFKKVVLSRFNTIRKSIQSGKEQSVNEPSVSTTPTSSTTTSSSPGASAGTTSGVSPNGVTWRVITQ